MSKQTARDVLLGIQAEEPVKLNDSFANVVIVDNIPVVDMSRYERLTAVIRKIFGGFGTIIEDGMLLPVAGEPAKTLGYCFIEYETPEMVVKAIAEGDNRKLDNKHKLRVNIWTDADKYAQVTDDYEPPTKEDHDSKTNLTSWLLDSTGRDQFVVRFAKETQVYWNDPHRKANEDGRLLAYGGEKEKARDRNWTEQYVAWSPQGLYLATFHAAGIAMWGGDSFDKLGRFPHADVTHIDISPAEKYLVTSNGRDRQRKTDPWCIQVYDIRSGKLLRGFERGQSKGGWPAFKWSHDDKFIVRTTVDTVSVYEVPSMGLLDKKSFKIPDVQEAHWCPTANIIAYWVPEKDNIPAKVALLEIPSRKLIREKHLYNVADIKMHWQASGDYLCVKLARKKTKKTIVHNFEIFRLRQKNIPVEVLEIEDNIVAFAWEPVGSRFSIIHGNPARPSVSLYVLKQTKLKLLKTLENRPANTLYWSPTGDYLVIAGLGEKNGALEFVNTNDMSATCETEHIMCTDVEWDPSGRYVITSTTQPLESGGTNWRSTMENGYKVWSCTGQMLAQVSLDQCYQVLWRPRPKTLFTKEQLQEIKDTLKEKYWKQFESEDDAIRQGQLSGVAKERAMWKTEWRQYRADCEIAYAEEAQERVDLRKGLLSDDERDFVEIEQVHEEEVSCETIDRS